MTKVKNEKSSTKQKGKGNVNPFEVHINRSKFKILGQKSKDDRGLPGISRAKAFKKREKTLLPEYRDRHKNSKFLDKRIGENNPHIDPEKKMMLRLVAEKKKQFSKESKLMLDDDEELLHGGMSLNEETMKDRNTFSDDDDEDDLLDASFVKDKHFGGDLFTKPKETKDGEQSNAEPKSRKEWIDDMIAESKKKKAETKMQKEDHQDAVSKLDAKFQSFMGSLKGQLMTDEDKEKSKKTCEFSGYDTMVRQILFDRTKRAKPADRLKTEEETAKEERERLHKLEDERQKRMLGHIDPSSKSHKSADALDDNWVLDVREAPIDEEKYSNIKSRIKTNTKLKDQSQEGGKHVFNTLESEDDASEDEEEEEAEVEESEDEEEEAEEVEDDIEEEIEAKESEEEGGLEIDEREAVVQSDNEEDVEEYDNESEEIEESENEEKEEESFNDEEVEESDIEEDEEEEMEMVCNQDMEDDDSEEGSEPSEKTKNKIKHTSVLEKKNNSKCQRENVEPKHLNDKSETSDEKEDLPYTFNVPTEYDGFWDLLENRTPDELSTIIERMITCNHPKLGADNKTKANTIFTYLLQTLHSICSVDPDIIRKDTHSLSYINPIIPHLYTLTQLNPNDCASALTEVIDEKYEEYISRKPRRYPNVDTFIFLKISGLLFPSSDFHHDVMTRVITFLTQMLKESKVECGRDVIALLFTASLLSEYLKRSHRFVGELLNALNGILLLSIPKSKKTENLPVNPPFKNNGTFSELLVLAEAHQSCGDIPRLTLSLINEEVNINESFKCTFLNEAFSCINKLCSIWTNLSSVRVVFHPTQKLLERIPLKRYPDSVNSMVQSLETSLSNLPKQMAHLKKDETIAKTLRMLEPSIEEIFEGIKKRSGDKDYQEKQKLLYKLKRERKGAKREIKRDSQFLARHQLKEVLESDAERKRKVNLIMQGLQTQESEHKKFKKFKSKK